MEKGTWITILIIIFIIAISYYAISKNGVISGDEFTECIAANATLYMQTGCFACERQKEAFGENYELLTIVNCAEDYPACAKEEVVRTPTWIIGYEKYIGYKTLEELSELTSCELKKPEIQNGS